MRKLLFCLLALCLIAAAAVKAQPVYQQGDFAPYHFTSVTAAIPTSSVTTVTLVGSSRHLLLRSTTISGTPSSAFNFSLDGTTPTTSNAIIDAGGSLLLDGLPAFSQVKILGPATPVGNYSILAW
jgi:hypothetical protein